MRALAADAVFPSDPVVTRWVRHGRTPRPAVLANLTALPIGQPIALPQGALRLDRPFARSTDPNGRETWSTQARVVTSAATVVRFARVEIAIIAWTGQLSEVTVRSRGRHLISWSDRREHRYFALAHDAATHIADLLATTHAAGPVSQVA